MMGAVKKTASEPPEHELIERFKLDYESAMLEARVSAEHTATEGWQRLYSGRRRDEREKRRELAQTLRDTADVIDSGMIDEVLAKQIGDAKKNLTEFVESVDGFEKVVVEPVRKPVDRCREIIAKAVEAARTEEDRHGLVAAGLESEMRTAVKVVPSVAWDVDLGRVTVE